MKKIYIQNWLKFKPYDNQTITDSYYLNLCNKIKKVLIEKYGEIIFEKFHVEDVDLLSCFLTSYFEDIISETNIWNTFVNIHKRLYKKFLPFYNTDEYYEKEINPQDIRFLIWYFFNTIQNDIYIDSYKIFFENMAFDIIEILGDAYEYAPENIYLKSFYTIDENETDFYIARNLIDTVLFKTYLFYFDTFANLKEKEDEIIKGEHDKEYILSYLNDNRDAMLHKSYTQLLSMKGKDWVAEIIGESHSLSNSYKTISEKITGYFFYKGQNYNDVFIEHIASGKKFNLTKKSLDHYNELKEIDTIIYMGIVIWQDEWWFSGVYFQIDFNADLILDEKNSIESRRAVNFLNYNLKETKDTLLKQFEAFKRFNNGSQIAFMPSDKIEDFTRNYIEYFNKSLKLSAKEIEKSKKRIKKGGFFGTEDKITDFDKASETGLVFFNPKSGIEIALAVNSAFPIPENPYFDIKNSNEHVMRLMSEEGLSLELAMFCIDNCKAKLPFFTKDGGKLPIDDIDFLLRFWKKSSYHSEPQITIA